MAHNHPGLMNPKYDETNVPLSGQYNRSMDRAAIKVTYLISMYFIPFYRVKK